MNALPCRPYAACEARALAQRMQAETPQELKEQLLLEAGIAPTDGLDEYFKFIAIKMAWCDTESRLFSPPTHVVDKVWHAHILADVKGYKQFCEHYTSGWVNHVTIKDPAVLKQMASDYLRCYREAFPQGQPSSLVAAVSAPRSAADGPAAAPGGSFEAPAAEEPRRVPDEACLRLRRVRRRREAEEHDPYEEPSPPSDEAGSDSTHTSDDGTESTVACG
jgi:hypothetical protein